MEGLRAGDRVRVHDETLRAILAARTPLVAARRIHLELGRAQAARPGADPVETAASFERAGATELAAEHLAAAAERAAAGDDDLDQGPGASPPIPSGEVGERRRARLDRAAALWERALALTPQGTAVARALSARRAGALAAAGRSSAAAGAYLSGIPGAHPAEALDRRLRAAEHLLVSVTSTRVSPRSTPCSRPTASAGRAPPTTRCGHWPPASSRCACAAPASPGSRGASARPVATGGHPETPGRIDPPAYDGGRIEALWSAGRGLSTIDPLRSSVFVVEALLAALAAGDAGHAVPALAFVGSIFVYHGGVAEEARGLALIEEASRFARASGDPHLLGFTWFCSGLARLCAGRFREALARVEEALGLLETRASGLAWERTVHRTVCLQALFELGALAERARRAEAWLRDARACDDRAAEVQAALAVAFSTLAAGDPPRAREMVRQAVAPLVARRLRGAPPDGALARGLHPPPRGRRQSRAGAAPRRLAGAPRIAAPPHPARPHRGAPPARAHRGGGRRVGAPPRRGRRGPPRTRAPAVRAGRGGGAPRRVAQRRGEIARAASGLEAAARGYASVEMMVHAATARRARGALLGGPEGRALVIEADALLAAEGVRDGARWTAMYTGVGV